MPLGKNIRYRFKQLGRGKEECLAFKGNKVIKVAIFKDHKKLKTKRLF